MNLIIVSNLENWEIARKLGIFGFPKLGPKKSKIIPGDNFIVYSPDVKAFINFGKITSTPYKDETRIWNKKYPHRIKIDTKNRDKKCNLSEVKDQLKIFSGKKNTAALQQSGIEINDHDFEILCKYITNSSVLDTVIIKKSTKKIGEELENRIYILLKKFGFTTILTPNDSGADITADIMLNPTFDRQQKEEVRLIFQCKNSVKGGTFSGLEDLVLAYSKRREKSKANRAIIVLSGYSIPEGHSSEQYNREEKVLVWNDAVIEYYEELFKKINKFALYQLLSDLRIHSRFDIPHSFPLLTFTQGEREYQLISAPVDWLLKASSVARRIKYSNEIQGYQRILDKKRVLRIIPEYINQGNWVFPNNIICMLDPEAEFITSNVKGLLTLPSKTGLLWVIDGQHRLYSFANVSAEVRKETSISCLVLNRLDDEDAAQIFVDVNDNAKKVPPALLLELSGLLGIETREYKIVKKLSNTKVFKNLIKGYSDRGGIINFVTFVRNEGMRRVASDKGPLLQNRSNLSEEEKIEYCSDSLHKYFSVIAESFSEKWGNSEYILSSDRGIRALLILYAEILNKYNRFSQIELNERIKSIAGCLAASDFDYGIQSLKGKYAGAGGARVLFQDWAREITATIPGFSDDPTLSVIKIPKEEDLHIEFKESIRWNTRALKRDDSLINEVLVTVNAFLNSDGGRLFLGISDSGRIVGLEKDLSLFGQDERKAKDSLRLFLLDQLKDKFDPKIAGYYKLYVQQEDGKLIVVIDVKPSNEAIYVKLGNLQEFYCREDNRSRKLQGPEQTKYIRIHFSN